MSKTVTFAELQKTEAYLRDKSARQIRFAHLHAAAAINAAANKLSEEEAFALVEAVRQELFDDQSGV